MTDTAQGQLVYCPTCHGPRRARMAVRMPACADHVEVTIVKALPAQRPESGRLRPASDGTPGRDLTKADLVSTIEGQLAPDTFPEGWPS